MNELLEPQEVVRYRGLKVLAILGLSALLAGFGVDRGGGIPDLSRFWKKRSGKLKN